MKFEWKRATYTITRVINDHKIILHHSAARFRRWETSYLVLYNNNHYTATL